MIMRGTIPRLPADCRAQVPDQVHQTHGNRPPPQRNIPPQLPRSDHKRQTGWSAPSPKNPPVCLSWKEPIKTSHKAESKENAGTYESPHSVWKKPGITLPFSYWASNEIALSSLLGRYLHENNKYLKRLLVHFKIVTIEWIEVNVWDESRIKTVCRWKMKLRSPLNLQKPASCWSVPDILASELIIKNSRQSHIESYESNGASILPLIVEPYRFSNSTLSIFQAINNPNPLYKRSEPEQKEQYLALSKKYRIAVRYQSKIFSELDRNLMWWIVSGTLLPSGWWSSPLLINRAKEFYEHQYWCVSLSAFPVWNSSEFQALVRTEPMRTVARATLKLYVP